MLYYENTMNNTKNIILITSIAAVLGFGIVAFQTNTVDALMDNTSEILDLGEKSEITTLAKPEGKGKTEPLEGSLIDASGYNTIKCSASRTFSCNIKNSGNGLEKVTLHAEGVTCAVKDVKDGASRASINTRKNLNPTECDFQSQTYTLVVYLNSNTLGEKIKFLVSFPDNSLVITEVPKIA